MPFKRDLNATSSFISNLLAILQLLSIMTLEQSELLFKFARCKLKLEMVATKIERKFWRKLILRQSEIFIAMSMDTTLAALAVAETQV